MREFYSSINTNKVTSLTGNECNGLNQIKSVLGKYLMFSLTCSSYRDIKLCICDMKVEAGLSRRTKETNWGEEEDR